MRYKFRYISSNLAGVIINNKIQNRLCHKFTNNTRSLFGFYCGEEPLPELKELKVYDIVYTPYTNFAKIWSIKEVITK